MFNFNIFSLIFFSCRPEAQKSPGLLRRAVSLRCARTEKSLNGKNNSNVLPPPRKLQERRGSLVELMSGCDENKETINSVISKLYRKADFDLSKAQRGVIFLDGMDKIGSNQNTSEIAQKQVRLFCQSTISSYTFSREVCYLFCLNSQFLGRFFASKFLDNKSS